MTPEPQQRCRLRLCNQTGGEISQYGRLRAVLVRKGKPIGSLDTLIAAHALAIDAILVTHNTREFARVEGLRLEDWVSR